MPKRTKLVHKKVGQYFYRHIWKTLKIGDTVEVCKGRCVFGCEVVERCGIEKYKLEIITKDTR